jgi:hypothetical protein
MESKVFIATFDGKTHIVRDDDGAVLASCPTRAQADAIAQWLNLAGFETTKEAKARHWWEQMNTPKA